MESQRWKTMNSKVSPGQMLYDKLQDKVAVDIATGSEQMDEYIAKAAYLCIHDRDFLNSVIFWEVIEDE